MKYLFDKQSSDEKNSSIAGPCVVESEGLIIEIADEAYSICKKNNLYHPIKGLAATVKDAKPFMKARFPFHK